MTSPKSKEQVVPEDVMKAAVSAASFYMHNRGNRLDDVIADAILADRERDQWQDIATAPKDGTPILAFNAILGVYNTAYQSREPNESDRFPCGFSGYLGHWFCYPTHWQPIPTPPKGGEE